MPADERPSGPAERLAEIQRLAQKHRAAQQITRLAREGRDGEEEWERLARGRSAATQQGEALAALLRACEEGTDGRE